MRTGTRLTLAAVVLLATTQLAWTVYVTTTGNVVKWYQPDVHASVDSRGSSNVPGEGAFQAVQASMATWNAVLQCAHPTLVYDGKVTDVAPGPSTPTNVILWETEAEWNANGHAADAKKHVIALTTLYYDDTTGAAHKFDMELADFAFTFTVTDNPAAVMTDVQNTVTHELGHVLGLDHSTVPEATMYLSAPSGDLEKRTLAADDIAGLCFIYAPLETPDASDASETSETSTAEPDASAEPGPPECCPWIAPEAGGDGGGRCSAGPTGSASVAFLLALAGLALARRRRPGEPNTPA